MNNSNLVTGYGNSPGRTPRRRVKRVSKRKRIFVGIVCAVLVFALIIGLMALFGWRLLRRTTEDGTTILFFGIMQDGSPTSGKITYSTGLTGILDSKTGVITYSNGSSYKGGLDDCFRKDGQGILTFASGNKYEGSFVHDALTGQGTLLYSDGASYVGGFKDGKKDGTGTYTWADGSVYTGGFCEDVVNGQGKFVSSDGCSYEGEYVNGIKEGQGTAIYANGDKYIGGFSGDMRNGTGTYTWANGEHYTGDFKDNNITGYGKYTWPSGRTYEGYKFFIMYIKIKILYTVMFRIKLLTYISKCNF